LCLGLSGTRTENEHDDVLHWNPPTSAKRREDFLAHGFYLGWIWNAGHSTSLHREIFQLLSDGRVSDTGGPLLRAGRVARARSIEPFGVVWLAAQTGADGVIL